MKIKPCELILLAVPVCLSPVRAELPGANGLILFMARDAAAIRTMNPDGTGGRHFFAGGQDTTTYAAWSGDGKTLVVSHGAPNARDIWVMNADGSGARKLMETPTDEAFPSWAPNGRQIAYESNQEGNADVFVVNADGSGALRLTQDKAADGAPSWSPDGTRLAFHSFREGNGEIYVMEANGANQVRLTTNAGDDGFPDWSPDGRRIVFQSTRDGNVEIYVMQADGSSPLRVTRNATSDEAPKWSPDGTRILFACHDGKKADVCSVAPDGSDLVRLTQAPVSGFHFPSWQPLPRADKTISVGERGFAPDVVNVNPGGRVRWDFAAKAPLAVADDQGMGLFGSGKVSRGGAYAATFFDAGSYSVVEPSMLSLGSVNVPVKVKPPQGPVGTPVTVVWSSRSAPAGKVFDVQVKLPGSTVWVYHLRGVRQRSVEFKPTTPGTYQVRARLRGAGSVAWSPEAQFTIR